MEDTQPIAISSAVMHEDEKMLPSVENDEIVRDKERLQRFHKEAMSFLAKAYSNDTAVIVEDSFDNGLCSRRLSDDFAAKRREELDRARLERFHAQAVSFLDRAYSNEPETIVVEESLSPTGVVVGTESKEMLRMFHSEAMELLPVVAGAPTDVDDEESTSSSGRRGCDSTMLLIERDRARLEQHYQDVMSFLERAEAEDKNVLVQERDVEAVPADRIQLQRYAQDAMSFLDKALQNDTSVIVFDETGGHSVYEGPQIGDPNALGRCSENSTSESFVQFPAICQPLADKDQHLLEALRAEEDLQVAADRLALERYDEEIGDFLLKAYQDDSSVIVEDADSLSSGSDPALLTRRAVNRERTSPESMRCRTRPDQLCEIVQAGDVEVQNSPLRKGSRNAYRSARLLGALDCSDVAGEIVDNSAGSGDCNLLRDAVQATCGLSENLDKRGAKIMDCECETFLHHRAKHCAPENLSFESFGLHAVTERSEVDAAMVLWCAERTPGTGENNDVCRYKGATQNAVCFHCNSHGNPEVLFGGLQDELPSDRVGPETESEAHREKQSSRIHSRERMQSPESQMLLVNVMLEDCAGRTREWLDVPLDMSLCRRVPRGSTVKLRLHPENRLRMSSTTGKHSSGQEWHHSAFHQLSKERDHLLTTLEEIVNERSMLAAEVKDITGTVQNAGVCSSEEGGVNESSSNIDLASELREAHLTMSKLTQEMEVTLSLLDLRYQETLQRAHKAEEKCLQLESDASTFREEFSRQSVFLSRALTDQTMLRSLLAKSQQDFETVLLKYEGLKRHHGSYKEDDDRDPHENHRLRNDGSVKSSQLQSIPDEAEPDLLNLQSSGAHRNASDSILPRLSSDSRHGETTLVEEESGHENVSVSVQGVRNVVQSGVNRGHNLLPQFANELPIGSQPVSHVTGLLLAVSDLLQRLKETKNLHITDETEAMHWKSPFEDFMKTPFLRSAGTSRMLELEAALTDLVDETGAREERLRNQLFYFRQKAEQAESAAMHASHEAKKGAEAARAEERRSLITIESERQARKAAEAEKNSVIVESRAWEKVAHQQMQLAIQGEICNSDVANNISQGEIGKVSSERVTRGDACCNESRNRLHEKKNLSAGESIPNKKKAGLRPRLFG